ncbi:MAG: hypothetical protein U9R69_04825, partial [Thermodesulfobacteriota bacterium]|nr:hypothetical protein [Thermodesulfobacteriota bacterium]
EPLTNRELEAERQTLKELRKIQIKSSCISDVLHAFVFIGLYYGQYLSGYAILVAVALSTVIALALATTSRDILKPSDQIAIGVLSLGTTAATIMILFMTMQQALTGSIVAGLTTGSIVIVGATLGRKIKMVLAAIEALKPIIDDDIARQELMALCCDFSELDDYRESAAQYLRPHLTYGELAAMKEWSKL